MVFYVFLASFQKNLHQEQHFSQGIAILDDAQCHQMNLNMSKHVRVKFLPKNTTSLTQLMDQGVIAAFKANYLNLLSRPLIDPRCYIKGTSCRSTIVFLPQIKFQLIYSAGTRCLWPPYAITTRVLQVPLRHGTERI